MVLVPAVFGEGTLGPALFEAGPHGQEAVQHRTFTAAVREHALSCRVAAASAYRLRRLGDSPRIRWQQSRSEDRGDDCGQLQRQPPFS